MQDALDSFYYIMNKYLEIMFGAYIFEGISIGMIMVTLIIFGILFTYLLGVPKMQVGGRQKYEVKDYKKH